MESPSAWARLGEGGKNGWQAPGPRRPSRICSRRAINTGRFADAERIPDHKGRQGRQGVLRFRDFEDGKVAETSTMQAQGARLKRIRSLARMARAGRPARSPEVAGYSRVARTCDGGADSRLPSRSGRPVRDITGYARGRYQCRPSSLFPRLGESFRC